MTKPTLLDLSDRLSDLEQTIADLEGQEIPEELKAAMDELFLDRSTAQEDYQTKINNLLLLIKSRESWVRIRQDRIKELQSLIKTDSNLVNRLKKYLLNHLIERDTKKFRTQDFNIFVAQTGGKAPIIIDDDVDVEDLPEQYLKITKAVDKTAIAKALKEGQPLDFAREGIRGNHLRIK